MRLYTTGQILRLSGVAGTTFQNWFRDQLIEPLAGGDGHGNHRQFTTMQVVGIVAAAKLRRGERGCASVYLAKVIKGFGAMTEKRLLELFDRGATHFVVIANGVPVLDGPRYDDMIDVRAIYHAVIAAEKPLRLVETG